MLCRSGKHTWLTQGRADKCCNPSWRKVLLILREHPELQKNLPEDDLLVDCEGVLCVHHWERTELVSVT